MNPDVNVRTLIKGAVFVILGFFYFLDQADVLALHLGLLASALFVVIGAVMLVVSRRPKSASSQGPSTY